VFPNKTTHEEVMKKVLSYPFVVAVVSNFVTIFINVATKRELMISLV
jgi:hypothetical protein